ncbi:MAG: carbon-nitrogen hydrolase family protein [Cyclobacteriaceae bacterium]
MRIVLAQLSSIKGDVQANLIKHIACAEAANQMKADVVMFPELSIINYEPTIAPGLAALDWKVELKLLIDFTLKHPICLCVGAPTQSEAGSGCHISMLMIDQGDITTYSKQYLHSDEIPYFVNGKASIPLIRGAIAPTICYELSQDEHIMQAMSLSPSVYMASVAKTDRGRLGAYGKLSEHATKHGVITAMVNAIGPTDDFISAGGSAVWDREGNKRASLDSNRSGLLMFDTTNLRHSIQYLD